MMEYDITLPYWESSRGKIDSTLFFKKVMEFFPDCTTVFIEVTSTESEVINIYQKYSKDEEYLPMTHTICSCGWGGKPQKFVCKFSVLEALVSVSKNYAESEILTHLFIYKNQQSILEFCDVFNNNFCISSIIPEEIVQKFCFSFNRQYTFEEGD